VFDDPNLVSSAGQVPVLALVQIRGTPGYRPLGVADTLFGFDRASATAR
jgi:hypothetical protein